MRSLAARALSGALALGMLMGVAAPAAAQSHDEPAFAGAAEIRLGDDVQSQMAGLPGEVHQYSFFATAGSRLRATLVTDRGVSLLADVRLTWPGGEEIATSSRVSRSNVRKSRIGAYEFPVSGVYVLEVVRRSGSGGYTLSTTARRDRRLRGLHPDPGDSGAWRFDAPGNSVLTLKIRAPRGHRGGDGPLVTGIIGPDGNRLEFVSQPKKQKVVVRGVLLPDDGQYTVLWSNPGGASRLRFAFDLRPFGGGRRSLFFGKPEGTAPGAQDQWPSTLDGVDGYVGSATCGRCHGQIYRDWTQTAHNLGSREWMKGGQTGVALVNDANGNGRTDFLDGLDLGTLPAFAGFGDDAPVLSWVEGDERPARVTIGDVTYEVERTMGGNGHGQQSYVARIGDSLYPLPFEYDAMQRTYVQFEAGHWYSEGVALYRNAAAVDASASYEARCAGCHSTGLFVATDTAGKIVAGWSESSVGCEQCHGPGAEHAASGNPALIQNPAGLLDGSAAGVAAANATCTKCHDRGHGVDDIPGSDVTPAYPYNATDGVAQYQQDLAEFFRPTSDPDDFYGYKANPVFAVGEPGFVAARRRYLQGREIAAGHHAPEQGFSASCIECHSPHAHRQEAMLATTIDRGVPVDTSLENNTFCLACHATHGPFQNVTKTDVQAINDGFVSTSVKTAVAIHMANQGMSVQSGLYDPTGTGVGRCDLCHMPAIAGEGAGGTDAAGFRVGGSKSHQFRNVWPRASVLYGHTNSCNVCHPTREGDPVATIIDEWANPDDDGDSTFHADTPRGFQNGVKNPDNGSGGLPCVQCHTTEGFVRIQVEGEETDQDDWNEMLYEAISHDEGITCRACHGATSEGSFDIGRQPLRFPVNELCGRCHNDETVKFADFRDDGEIVRHPQREMLAGTAGEPIPNSGRYENTAHSLFPDGCVTCHFDARVDTGAKHDFQVRVETCERCHDGLLTFDRPAFGDYDGNGATEGIQTEVRGLLDVLVEGLLLDPEMRFANGRFEYGESSDGSMTGASEAQKRAAFNYYSVIGDASYGVHNAARTVQLLQRSYEDVTGSPVPGADLR